jgi:hypothetical protein
MEAIREHKYFALSNRNVFEAQTLVTLQLLFLSQMMSCGVAETSHFISIS